MVRLRLRSVVAAFVLAVPLLAAGSPVPQRMLVTTRSLLVIVDGDRRQIASAGAEAANYTLLGTLADGSVLVSYVDTRFAGVEAIAPGLTSRTIKAFPRTAGTVGGFAPDGFVVFDGTGLARRYDLRGSLVGAPAAAVGATMAIGVGDALVTLGAGRLSVWDARGRLRKQILVDGSALAAMPDGRFAIVDAPDYEVRQYTTDLAQTAALRFPTQAIRAIAAGADGSLAVLTGVPACAGSTSEVDVFDDLHAQPAARIHNDVANAASIALDHDAVYVANGGCAGGDGFVSTYAHDGTELATIRNVGSPIGVLPFPRPTASPGS